tara:strand:- start:1363 stop:3975 length:2613 start_codon:yes stop_codon:yes gene_type:complete
MTLVTQSIPNLINGISEQNAVQRNPTQAESQVNFQSLIVDGLSKRPPLEFKGIINSSQHLSNKSKITWINRDEDDRYVVVWTDGLAPKVYDLTGTSKSVDNYGVGSDTATYLDCSNPQTELKCINIADYTFVVNTTKTVAADSATTTDTTGRFGREFLIYVKTTAYGRLFTVTLTHADWSSSYPHGIQARYQMPSGKDASTANSIGTMLDTTRVADILMYGKSSQYYKTAPEGIDYRIVKLNATGGVDSELVGSSGSVNDTDGLATFSTITSEFTFERIGSTIYGSVDESGKTFGVETEDGFGNNGMYTIKDSIQDFANLPAQGKTGMVIKITGDEGDSNGDYYVSYNGDGVWNETVKPGISVGLDNSTMPHALINDGDGTFTFRQVDWNDRVKGDTETNPNPSFVGKKINNLTFFKNRLGILTDQNIVLTENSEFFNFFATTNTDVLDTDPIDVATSGTTVDKLYNAIEFNQQLLLFSSQAQYILESSGDTITPVNAIITKTSTFTHNTNVTPIDTGRFVYFMQTRNEKASVVEYYADNDSLVNDGIDLNSGTSNLIDSNAHTLAANSIHDTLFVVTGNVPDTSGSAGLYFTPSSSAATLGTTEASRIYIYKYFWDGQQKQQSAWSYWEFPNTEILSVNSYDSDVYVIYNMEGQVRLSKIDLRNPNFSYGSTSYSYPLLLDHWNVVASAGSYDSATDTGTYTLPYVVDNQVLVAFDFNGIQYTITSFPGSALVNVEGTGGSSKSLVFGVKYTSTYQFSTPYVRKAEGQAITSGRFQVRRMLLNYVDSGFFRVQVNPDNRDVYNYDMNGIVISNPDTTLESPNIVSGEFNVPIQARNTAYTLTIRSDSVLPCHIINAELEGYYHNRANVR